MTRRTSIYAVVAAAALLLTGGSASAELPGRAPTPAPKISLPRVKAWSTTGAPATRTTATTTATVTTNLVAWPETARRRQLLISRGWRTGEFYLWYIADARNVLAIYLTTSSEQRESAVAAFTRDMTAIVMSSPTASVAWGIAGAVPKEPPPPPPPDPGGMPDSYVQQVLQTAANMDRYVLAPQLATTTTQ